MLKLRMHRSQQLSEPPLATFVTPVLAMVRAATVLVRAAVLAQIPS
jgi:hypothetical protein